MTGAAFTERINLFNPIDFATAGILYTNMYYRVNGDTGYLYRRLRAGPNFSDNWHAFRADSNVPEWIRPARAPVRRHRCCFSRSPGIPRMPPV